MLDTYVIKGMEKLKNFLNDNILGLSCVLDSNYLKFTGDLWGIKGLEVSDDCYIYINDTTAYTVRLDTDNKFLCISTSTGVDLSDYTETGFALMFYAETEEGYPISNLNNIYNKAAFDAYPFYLDNTRVANLSLCFNLCVSNTDILSSFDSSTIYRLVPMFIGGGKMKNLYVCNNAVAVIGTMLSGPDGIYKCIGTRIWYKVD